jgi:hypothetical protein
MIKELKKSATTKAVLRQPTFLTNLVWNKCQTIKPQNHVSPQQEKFLSELKKKPFVSLNDAYEA